MKFFRRKRNLFRRSNFNRAESSFEEKLLSSEYSALSIILTTLTLLHYFRSEMNAVSTSFQELREKLMNPPVKRVLMHVGFWILWLSRTFYDIISLYGLGLGECLFMLV